MIPSSQDRVIADLNLLGVVGEETNLLVAYLATISRISEHPFGVVVQSSSAAGKSPPSPTPCASSCRKRTSRATRHSRARPSTTSARATSPTRCWRSRNNKAPPAPRSALKLLVTEGRLSIASTGKDPASGRLRTRSYEVQGPVALVLTTTATDLDPELSNRLVVLGVDEDQAQKRAIHAAQRRAASLEGLVSRWRKEALVLRHRNAQRLLEALPVVISGAEELSFPNYATRHRRDHQKLLSLIGASALLHQHQRSRGSIEVDGRAVDYLQADASDVALGLRLAKAVLQASDELAPQTRRLLAACEAHVAERAASTRRRSRRSPSPAGRSASCSAGPSTRSVSGSRSSSRWSTSSSRRAARDGTTATVSQNPANPAEPRGKCAKATRGVKCTRKLEKRPTPRNYVTRMDKAARNP